MPKTHSFCKDDSEDMDKISENLGAERRTRVFDSSKSVTLQGPLFQDIFMQKRYLLNNTRMTIRLDRSPLEFVLLNLEAAGSYKLQLEDVVLKVRMIELNPATQYAISKSLETKPALYPYTRRDIRVENLPVGFN